MKVVELRRTPGNASQLPSFLITLLKDTWASRHYTKERARPQATTQESPVLQMSNIKNFRKKCRSVYTSIVTYPPHYLEARLNTVLYSEAVLSQLRTSCHPLMGHTMLKGYSIRSLKFCLTSLKCKIPNQCQKSNNFTLNPIISQKLFLNQCEC